ncbi:hypothetical protein DIS18_02090 [Algibacter marinivivus]|uniref:Uncharacterized protein n=1 Tax=Algibacter marinivivus TaxID=2100723 RepID=A0A2U2X6E7_9FLAO|nr:hypothetical protein [Algibacter marinivivus]PWH83366.1 hypothetical protein DIS18_02090 [Algibacter marinivivus]
MKSTKRILRLIALVFMIGLATILPVPITFYRKDNMPKFKIEQIDKKQEDENKDDIKEIS